MPLRLHEATPKLPGTIYTAAEEIEAAGGHALPCIVDVREEDQIREAVEKTVATFGGIDILINNASAINLTPTLETSLKRFDLMHDINTRGTFACYSGLYSLFEKGQQPAHTQYVAAPKYRGPGGLHRTLPIQWQNMGWVSACWGWQRSSRRTALR